MNTRSNVSNIDSLHPQVEIITPAFRNLFILENVNIDEKVSDLFEMEIFAVAQQDISPRDIIGADLKLRLIVSRNNDLFRTYTGVITEFQKLDKLWDGKKLWAGECKYKLIVRPALWLLSQRKDHRIWQHQNAVDVLETLLREHRLNAPDTAGVIRKQLPQLEYSVQYGETDYQYALRKMEEAGLFWWFVHGENETKLHVANHQFGWLKNPSHSSAIDVQTKNITSWCHKFNYIPSSTSTGDWNFETPKNMVHALTTAHTTWQNNNKHELFEYPSRALTEKDAELASKLRMQAIEADCEWVEASSELPTLQVGQCFQPNYEDNIEYVVTSIIHEIVLPGFPQSGERRGTYKNKFRAIPARVPLTPHLKTPRPLIHGTSPAIVAGPPGEEIYTDNFGRVKLYFPWDRRARKDGSDTLWVRVNQAGSGASSGTQDVPRVGTEVTVSFSNGDPDRPVVMAVVNNPDNMPHYDLPRNKTLMALRSKSTGSKGGNEITFENKGGAENLFIHAQGNRTEMVRQSVTSRVDEHVLNSVGGNKVEQVAVNQRTEIGGASITVVGDIGAVIVKLITESLQLTTKTAALLKKSADKSSEKKTEVIEFSGIIGMHLFGILANAAEALRVAVTNGPNPQTDAGLSFAAQSKVLSTVKDLLDPCKGMAALLVAGSKSECVGVSSAQQVGVSKVTTVGKSCLEDVGKYKETTVGEQYVLKCGASSITLNKDGTIEIKGTSVKITNS
ncbi:type VI secretion system tip protein TssI/VgrG [Ochrobactrum sp. GPK 3]|uniref:type VI secretion system Vgr family protein n=1 Tax=Brucella sp. 22210 TaxID=3453892 RepID=UPI0031385564